MAAFSVVNLDTKNYFFMKANFITSSAAKFQVGISVHLHFDKNGINTFLVKKNILYVRMRDKVVVLNRFSQIHMVGVDQYNPKVNLVVFGKDRSNRTTDVMENVSPKPVFWV